jgi:hypothetical protein
MAAVFIREDKQRENADTYPNSSGIGALDLSTRARGDISCHEATVIGHYLVSSENKYRKENTVPHI